MLKKKNSEEMPKLTRIFGGNIAKGGIGFKLLFHSDEVLSINKKTMMKALKTVFFVALCCTISLVKAQDNSTVDTTATPEYLLDKAVIAEESGDKVAAFTALKAGTAALETEAKENKGSLKDKLLGQVGNLQALMPLLQGGGLGKGILSKAVSLAKLMIAHQRIEKMLGGGSIMGSLGGITKNMGLLKKGMSALSPATQSSANPLIDNALSGLGKLSKGGPAAANALMPTVKNQLGSVLDMVKGGL
jgi:hypothetical protein